MSTLLDLQPTSSAVMARADRPVALHAGLLVDAVFGTNAGFPNASRWREVAVGVTTTPAIRRVPPLPQVHEEVRQLRDQICARGLSRQDIARAVGVDRRSLSGWVRGEIHPTSARVDVLRALARLTVDVDDERPGRARDVLLSRRTGRALIDRIATEREGLLGEWRSSLRAETVVMFTARVQNAGEPIWAAAARALAEGRLAPPSWERTVRPADTYEMDVEQAAPFAEQEPARGRSGYR